MFTDPNFPEDSFFNKYSNEPPAWFEFLLDESGRKLQMHLDRNLDPNAAYLISLFIDKASSQINNTGGAVRQYSNQLWELSVETGSYVQWNYKTLMEIPTSIRHKLLSHLVKVTVPSELRAVDITQLDFEKIPKIGLAALFLYHRWICDAFVHLQLPQKCEKKETDIPGYLPATSALQIVEQELSHSVEFLQKIAANKPELTLPQISSLKRLSVMKEMKIDSSSVACQALYDLGEVCFLKRAYAEAYCYFKEVDILYDQCDKTFLSFSKTKAVSYINGLQFITGSADIRDSTTLTSKLEMTKASNYEGCVEILLNDNFKRELSLCHRKNFVKEVHESSNDQSLHKQAYLCNVMLEVIMGMGTRQLFWDMLKGDKDLVLDFVISATVIFLENNVSNITKQNLKLFFMSILAKRYMKNRFNDIVGRVGNQLNIPPKENRTSLDTHNKTEVLQYQFSKDSELAACYKELSSSSSFTQIKDVISKICQLQPNFHMRTFCEKIFKDVRKINLFLPLTDCLACPRPLAYALCYKIAQLYYYKQFDRAQTLLGQVKEYLKNAQYAAFKRGNNSRPLDKLEVIIEAFVLNQSIRQSHHRVKPAEDFFDRIKILNASHHSNAGNQNVSFETSIASAVLLNLEVQPTILEINDGYDFIAGQMWSYIQNSEFDLTTLFKLLVSMHSQKPPTNSITRTMFLDFCYQIFDERTLELLAAILIHLFNACEKVEPHSLNCDIITRSWPKLGKEAHIEPCLSSLLRVLEHALIVHPHNLKLIQIKAHCNMYLQDNDNTIRLHLAAGVLISDYYSNMAVLDRWLENSFYNIVKCCMNINAHVEVALLCCMKTPPEYSTSFQALKRTSCQDDLYLYYPLFWDVNLLECAIAQHHKRNEIVLRDFLIGLMGRPEINENNPPALIKRTTLSKKAAFLRTLLVKFLSK